jgi:anti-anti-sigma regulatory factor
MSKTHSHTVDLGIEPSIKTVAELRDRLITAIAENDAVVISATKATSIDISVLQLLASAHRSAGAAGKPISLHAPKDGALRLALQRSGFVSPGGVPLTREGEFWISTPAAKDEAA